MGLDKALAIVTTQDYWRSQIPADKNVQRDHQWPLPKYQGTGSNGFQQVILRIRDVCNGIGSDLRLQLLWHNRLVDQTNTGSCFEHRQISEHEMRMQSDVGTKPIIQIGHYIEYIWGPAVFNPYRGQRRVLKHPEFASGVSVFDRIFAEQRGVCASAVNILASEFASSPREAPLIRFTEWDSCPSQSRWTRLQKLVHTAKKQFIPFGLHGDTWVRTVLLNIHLMASISNEGYGLAR